MANNDLTGDIPENSLAVVGMVGRFPGANSVDEFWDMLCAGKEGITFFDPDELDKSIPGELRANPDYVKARGVIADFDRFDARFFDVSPLEAMLMDPQQRLMLEMAWAALENSGHPPSAFDGLIGVYAGMNWNRYGSHCVWRRPDIYERYGAFNTSLVNECDFLATRISYKLNLKGPSVNVTTACSTSLVAIAQASSALLGYDCDMALAGGVSISVPVNSGYLYQEGGMLSADGHCRTFDEQGSGTTFNDGAGFVVLRRLEDAVSDGDQIYAVIRGFGVNNDGADKVSFTAPSVTGQADAVRSAIDYAGIEPQSIGFVETHGTATPLGDPIEVAALKKAFAIAPGEKNFRCAIGSAKTNVGHLIHAAGVAGFIKASLAVYHGKIPANIHFEKPNPKLELEGSGFYVNAKLEEWQTDGHPRRAGVSSFGVGGTNAHIIVEQPPDIPAETNSDELRLVCVSAKDKEALAQQTTKMQQWLKDPVDGVTLDSVAHTSQFGRQAFKWRSAWIADSITAAEQAFDDNRRCIRGRPLDLPAVGFMFTGQGSQRINMGAGLRETNATFRDWFDRGAAILRERCDLDLPALIFADGKVDESIVEQTKIAQPALFLYEFSLAKSLEAIGLTPEILVGHSIGELVAATFAGVWSFEDGLVLAAKRGAAMQALPAGSMVALYCSEDEARELITDGLAVAGMNAPELTVVSGPSGKIDAFCEELDSRDVPYKKLRTSHAFHSDMMKPAVVQMQEEYGKVKMSPPSIAVVSTVTGQLMTEAEATSPDYWARQLLEPVRFAAAVQSMAAGGDKFLVEVGPGSTLTTLAGQNSAADQIYAKSATPGCGMDSESDRQLLESLAAAWTCGAAVDLSRQWQGVKPRKAPLPTYPFAREKHWIDPPDDSNQLSPVMAADVTSANQTFVQTDVVQLQSSPNQTEQPAMSNTDKISILCQRISGVFEDTSGYDLEDADFDASFIELGFDSLLLTQASSALKKEFAVDISFRELMEDFTTLRELADHFADKVEIEVPDVPAAAPTAAAGVVAQPTNMGATMSTFNSNSSVPSDVQALIDKQLQLMQQQLQVLAGGGQPATASQPAAVAGAAPAASTTPEVEESKPAADKSDGKTRTPGTRIQKDKQGSEELTRAQQSFVDKLVEDYTSATAKSKDFVQKHRQRLADPRTVSGFTPLWKEMVYPIVTNRSKGSKVWDVDGREYVDVTNGFGPIFFGHSPDFVTEAVIKQLQEGIETGPQSPLAGDVAELFCEMTGNERVAFANTGSEAVLAALRLARTITARDKVVIFEGAYHGIFDEVVVRPGRNGAGLPAAPGIPREMTQNIIVLPYGTDESLETIKGMADELAAVMVEPVQSRQPELQPAEFLKAVRKVTEASGTAFIFDEVVTGFRVHPGGAQAYFDIRADLAVYGKVVGGGYPIGMVAGKSKFMDALDGGQWQFGDDSIPEIGVTFFAGTFVRHPLALAATKAVLLRLKEEGPELHATLSDRTSTMVGDLKTFLKNIDVDVSIEEFASYFYISVPPGENYGGLLFYLMRLYGVHVWDHRPCFITTSHTKEDLALFSDAFKRAVSELVRAGFLRGDVVAVERAAKTDSDKPPVEGARLGKDASGMPAWFAPDPDRPGKYVQIDKKRAS